MKPIFVHCHIFKNAGTSLIEAFKRSFPGKCLEIEPQDKDDFICTETLKACLSENKNLVFISSHRIKLPLPKYIQGRPLIPIIFVRDPIDRLGSVYRFEKKQSLGSVYSSLAKMTDLKGFLNTILQVDYLTMISNVQAEFCGLSNGLQVDQMTRYLKNNAFIGLVEDYNFSLAMLEKTIRHHYPECNLVPLTENTTKNGIDASFSLLVKDLGAEFTSNLVKINEVDLKLNESAMASLSTMWELEENKEYYKHYSERHGLNTKNEKRRQQSLSLSDAINTTLRKGLHEVEPTVIHSSSWVLSNNTDFFEKFTIEAAKLEILNRNAVVAGPKDSIKVDVKMNWKSAINCAVIGVTVRNHLGQSIFAVNNLDSGVVRIEHPMRAIYSIVFEVPQMISGLYSIDVDVGIGLPGKTRLLSTARACLTFGVETQKMNITTGCVLLPATQFGLTKYAS